VQVLPGGAWTITALSIPIVRPRILRIPTSGTGEGVGDGIGVAPGSRDGMGLRLGVGWGWEAHALHQMTLRATAIIKQDRPNGTSDLEGWAAAR
jgi:hypothetical protein